MRIFQKAFLLRSWVKHWALQLMSTDGSLKDYFLWSPQSPLRREGRMQNQFPLPLWYDDRAALNEIIDEMQVKDGPGVGAEEEIRKARRPKPLEAWVMARHGRDFTQLPLCKPSQRNPANS